ncbi:MAG: ABC transporter substrate-binding protein [Opitutaceae bacterium]
MIARLALVLSAVALVAAHAVGAPLERPPRQVVQSLCDSLVQAMKGGASLGFEGRRKLLDAELRRDVNFPLMTRLVVGPSWRDLSAQEQRDLVAAFSDYSIAVYAGRFKAYAGERFVVEPDTSPLAGGIFVRTKLIPASGDAVVLDYLLRQANGRWRIIDVYLNGTISELAAQRSEYSAELRSGGAPELIKSLRRKTAQLAASG